MRPDEFERILRYRFFCFKPHIHLFGGEPLLHPEFPEFLTISRQYHYRPSLTTNGDYLEKYTGIINNSSVGQINISVNVSGKKPFYAGCRSLIKSIRLLAAKKIVNLNFAITIEGYDKLEEVVMVFNKAFGKGVIGNFTCQHFMWDSVRADIGKAIRKIDSTVINYQVKRLKRSKLNFPLSFLPDIAVSDIEKYYNSQYSFRNRCFLPWAGLSIYPDLSVAMGGGVLGCNTIVGDLRRQSLKSVWGSESLQKERRYFHCYGLKEQCNRCCQKFYY